MAGTRSDAREKFKNYTSRRLQALIEAAAEARKGIVVSKELNDAISELIREFRLERRYKQAWFAHAKEWPETDEARIESAALKTGTHFTPP